MKHLRHHVLWGLVGLIAAAGCDGDPTESSSASVAAEGTTDEWGSDYTWHFVDDARSESGVAQVDFLVGTLKRWAWDGYRCKTGYANTYVSGARHYLESLARPTGEASAVRIAYVVDGASRAVCAMATLIDFKQEGRVDVGYFLAENLKENPSCAQWFAARLVTEFETRQLYVYLTSPTRDPALAPFQTAAAQAGRQLQVMLDPDSMTYEDQWVARVYEQ